jgi:protein-S-isoprenylcysteine O-methyltransferase Ste14
MKTTMTAGGIGPRLALICLPYIVLSLSVMYNYPQFLNLGFLDLASVKLFAYFWLFLGISFWAYSAITFMRGFIKGRLITWGPYAFCRNPIYASVIIFIIPAFALIFHSGVLFSVALTLYIGFKLCIHGERIVLRKTFGEAYEQYEKSVNEFIPVPVFHRKTNNIPGKVPEIS